MITEMEYALSSSLVVHSLESKAELGGKWSMNPLKLHSKFCVCLWFFLRGPYSLTLREGAKGQSPTHRIRKQVQRNELESQAKVGDTKLFNRFILYLNRNNNSNLNTKHQLNKQAIWWQSAVYSFAEWWPSLQTGHYMKRNARCKTQGQESIPPK